MKNLPLILSSCIVIPVALVYGLRPDLLFEVTLDTTDELNVYSAIMGLYLAFASFWIVGILQPVYWKSAMISTICFMFGLALGRLISLFSDGLPSTIFILGTIGEIILGVFGCYILRREKES